ncbi:MAG: hydrolase [Sphingomonas sp. 66-10]|uniref:dienelactone hydrolase family protein n=1 Tax=Sphingomonas sp. 66-10 TaxID=1895848 RepID=UPI00092AD202|nr:alpha/beta hydrolase [Sphingomonas sp. 66-10]OJU22393.1 MAG: hydrolase [Sphingomonas sp. 66-10]
MDHTALTQFSVSIRPDGIVGIIGIPPSPAGLVIFAHGSGSGRLSPRNNHVALGLRQAGFATLLLDLLTPSEEKDRAKVFDIGLLARRLLHATDWAATVGELARLPIGYFGASTGAGAALLAAATAPDRVKAIISRGGRPDLAGEAMLERVRAPTLLIVGSLDGPVITLNREAMRHLRCPCDLVIVPGAGHLFEEPGTLDEVIGHAQNWFRIYLPEGART